MRKDSNLAIGFALELHALRHVPFLKACLNKGRADQRCDKRQPLRFFNINWSPVLARQ